MERGLRSSLFDTSYLSPPAPDVRAWLALSLDIQTPLKLYIRV